MTLSSSRLATMSVRSRAATSSSVGRSSVSQSHTSSTVVQSADGAGVCDRVPERGRLSDLEREWPSGAAVVDMTRRYGVAVTGGGRSIAGTRFRCRPVRRARRQPDVADVRARGGQRALRRWRRRSVLRVSRMRLSGTWMPLLICWTVTPTSSMSAPAN